MNTKSLFWIIPFCSFVAGYTIMSLYTGKRTVTVPSLIGESIFNALVTCSDANVHLKIIAVKENGDLPHATVLEQIPESKEKIKENQTIYIVVSTHPPRPTVPAFNSESISAREKELINRGFKIIKKQFHHILPKDSYIAHIQIPGEKTTDNTIIFYVSSGNEDTIIWPSLCGYSLTQVEDFLATRGIVPHIIQEKKATTDNNSDMIVVDQRPVAGSIIRGSQQPYVQLRVSRNTT